MPLKTCQIWSYDEIGMANTQLLTIDSDVRHDISNNLTDDELVKRLKKLHEDIEFGYAIVSSSVGLELEEIFEDDESDDQDTWDFVGIARTRTAAIVEWKSDRNHQAITTVIWDRD